MTACFGNTSYFLAMLVPQDLYHGAACRWAETSLSPIVTSDYVVLEVANFLSPQPTRTLFVEFLRILRADSRISVVPASNGLMKHGTELYGARPDKSWSLKDCISFEIMRDHGLSEALTADRHFEQAGFSAILKNIR
ncbi:MAG: PIN domain-containing protein [Planctomycetota bacterium]